MWWELQCPARGPALMHVHFEECATHPRNVCCECGQTSRVVTSSGLQAPGWPPNAPAIMPPVDVQARLRALGMIPAEETSDEMEDIREEHDDSTPVEPKMVDGRGPQGKFDGKGRGTLSYRQELRLKSWKRWIIEIGGDDAAAPEGTYK